MIRDARTHRPPTPKPNVLILIDAEIVSGPGKGLFQFLRHAPAEALRYRLCTFDAAWDPRREFAEEARRRGLQVCSLSQRWRFDPAPLWQAVCLVRRLGMNLVQTHGYKADVVGLFLQRLLRLRWVAFAHGWTEEDRRIAWYNRLDQRLVRYPDRVVAVSRAMSDRLCALGVPACRVVLIPNAIDRADLNTPGAVHEDLRKRFGIGPEEKLIGVIGRLSREKGQRYAIEALPHLIRNGLPQIRVLFAGDGPDRLRLEAQARAAGVSDRVIFAGHLADAAAIYRAIDVCVLPSLSEGLPNVVLEAMLYAKPVVATAVGGVPEVIQNGENGLLVPAGDAAALAKGVAAVLADADLAQRVGLEGARSLYPAFDPQERTQRILRLYTELVGAQSPRPRRPFGFRSRASMGAPDRAAVAQVRRAVFPDGVPPVVGAPKYVPDTREGKVSGDDPSTAYARAKDAEPGLLGRILRCVFYVLLFGSGVASLRRWWFRLRGERPVAILMYHRVNDLSHDPLTVSVDRFIEQMLFLRQHYRVISLGHLVELAKRGEATPRGAVAITFDDGYADNARIGAPILARLGIPACFFVSALHVEEGQDFLHDKASPFRFETMSWDEVRALTTMSMEVGAHTLNHCDLGQADPERLRDEVVGSKALLEQRLGCPVVHFAFPFGKERHVPPAAVSEVKRAGYGSACTAFGGVNLRRIDPFSLDRVGITEGHDLLSLRAEIEGLSFQSMRQVWFRRR